MELDTALHAQIDCPRKEVPRRSICFHGYTTHGDHGVDKVEPGDLAGKIGVVWSVEEVFEDFVGALVDCIALFTEGKVGCVWDGVVGGRRGSRAARFTFIWFGGDGRAVEGISDLARGVVDDRRE